MIVSSLRSGFGKKTRIKKICLKRLTLIFFVQNMFKTLDLSHILLTLNYIRTEFTAVSEDRKQVCWISQLRVEFSQIAQDYLLF